MHSSVMTTVTSIMMSDGYATGKARSRGLLQRGGEGRGRRKSCSPRCPRADRCRCAADEDLPLAGASACCRDKFGGVSWMVIVPQAM